MTLGELIGPEAKLPQSWSGVPIAGLAADSRKVMPGYLFAALSGVKTDGMRFIDDAVQRGAAAILMSEGAARPTNSLPIIADKDPRRRLALIAARFFALQPKTVVAVTGTNGKTSVASFVRQIWTGEGLSAASLDRYLQSIHQPQIYGTQFIGNDHSPVTQAPYTSDLITDGMRKKLGVQALDDQKKYQDEINKQIQKP